MRALHPTLLAATALVALACTEGRVPTAPHGLRPTGVRLSMHALVGSSGRAVQVVARYARASAPSALIALDSLTVPLDTNDTQISVTIDIQPCLSDAQRELPDGMSSSEAGSICVLHLTATLLSATDQAIDQATLPPLPASPSAPVTSPSIALGVAVGKVTVSPSAPVINAIGYAVDLTVTAVDKLGQPIGRPALLFRSLDSTVATVDSLSGHVVGKALGVAKIVVTSRDQMDTATVTVRQVPKTVTLSGVTDDLFPGDSTVLAATLRDSADVAIPAGSTTVEFVSSDPTIALVDATTGRLQAVKAGSSRVEAIAGPASATLNVAVKPFVVYAACSFYSAPVWVGYQQGVDGPWKRVSMDADSIYRFRISDLGAVEFVEPHHTASATEGYNTNVYYGTATELQQMGVSVCPSAPSAPVTKSFSGTMNGLAATGYGTVDFAGHSTFVYPSDETFTINNAPDGAHGLLALSYDSFEGASRATGIIVRRGIDPADGSTLPTLDFAGPEAFAPVTATLTINGLGGRQGDVTSYLMLGGETFEVLSGGSIAGNTAQYSGLPASKVAAGDVLALTVQVSDSTSYTIAQTYAAQTVDRTMTIGPPLATPSLGWVAKSTYPRLQLSLPVQAEYGAWLGVNALQRSSASDASEPSPGDRYYSASATATYLGSARSTWILAGPDWTAGSGYNPDWGLKADAVTEWSVVAYNISAYDAGASYTDGAGYMGAARNGTLGAAGASPYRALTRAPALARSASPPPARATSSHAMPPCPLRARPARAPGPYCVSRSPFRP